MVINQWLLTSKSLFLFMARVSKACPPPTGSFSAMLHKIIISQHQPNTADVGQHQSESAGVG